MKRYTFLFILTLLFTFSFSQKLTYSDPEKKDNSGMTFEILGKFSSGTLVYKYVSRQHFIAVYGDDMKIITENELDFLPDKVIDADFVVYPDHFFIIYQYQKNNVVYCAAADVSDMGVLKKQPDVLESTRVSFFADNKIYSCAFSEDKSKILICKRYIKNDRLDFTATIFDAGFKPLDSLIQHIEVNQRKELFSEVAVDNNGNFIFAQSFRKNANAPSTAMILFVHRMTADTMEKIVIPLDDNAVNMPLIKIDNRNGKYLLNSFYYDENDRNIKGMLSVTIGITDKIVNTAFNPFSSDRQGTGRKINAAYDNLIPKNVILRKSGGFLLIAEDFYYETLYDDNRWNRYDPYYPYMPSGAANGYYLYNPYYNSYRPFGSNSSQTRTRYYYNNIFIADVDSTLQMKNVSEIEKRQYENDNDNSLSFGYMNKGRELHFMFVENSENKSVITDNLVSLDGSMKKFPLIRNEQRNYEFMPKLAKQTGAGQVIVPFIYFSKIGFARLEL